MMILSQGCFIFGWKVSLSRGRNFVIEFTLRGGAFLSPAGGRHSFCIFSSEGFSSFSSFCMHDEAGGEAVVLVQ